MNLFCFNPCKEYSLWQPWGYTKEGVVCIGSCGPFPWEMVLYIGIDLGLILVVGWLVIQLSKRVERK